KSHDLDLVRRFHAATLIDDDRCGTELHSGPSERELGGDETWCPGSDGEPARAQAQIAQRVVDEHLGILILLPHPNLESSIHLILGALLLEGRRDDDRLSRFRQDESEESLAPTPLDAGEICH